MADAHPPGPDQSAPQPGHSPNPASAIMTVWSLPVLPLKNTVLFPHMFMPLAAGRPSSVAAVEAALATEGKAFLLVAQRNTAVEDPGPDDLYRVATRAVIKRMARTPDRFELLVQGMERVRLTDFLQTQPYLVARAELLPL